MRKKLFLSVLMATMIASCVSDDGLGQKAGQESSQTQADGPVPVGFSAYAARGVTRSGVPGVVDMTALRRPEGSGGGFGVFAYYTEMNLYDQLKSPNFMYNQGVFDVNNGAGEARWEYTPLMYWPNEYGSDASSVDQDKVTFFAYAPYVPVTSAASGQVADQETGITGFTSNSATGDPLVKFVSTFDASKSVDLCWGVCDQTGWDKIQGGGSQAMTVGLPWLNVEHPAGTSQRMKFNFRHALAQLNVQIDADPDTDTHNNTSAIDPQSKVYVRYISFTGIALQGALNLNNTLANTPRWLNYDGSTDLTFDAAVTVHDGRLDGSEGQAGAVSTAETPTGLNPNIVQDENGRSGVTNELQNLLKPRSADPAVALTEPIFVIPTGQAMRVTIVYDVETKSGNVNSYLSDGTTKGVSIKNEISKTIDFGGGLQSGKKYTLKLHLGMNSVKFDAYVGDWENSNPTSTDGWLPGNTASPGTFGLTKTAVTLATSATTTVGAVNVPDGESVTWTTSNEGVASLEQVAGTRAATATGRNVRIRTGNTPGTATVTATTTSGKTASCVITVSATAPTTTVTLDKTALSLYPVGQGTSSATITATTANPAGAAVVWASSDDEVATVVDGLVTARSAGSATITASVNGGATATCAVSVSSIRLNKSTTTIYIGGSETLTATTAPNASETVTWQSSNTSVATVSNGTVTAKAAGTATITATSASGARAACAVTVNSKPAATVTVAPAPIGGLVYNNSELTLASAGTASGGTMQYALGTASAATGSYSSTIPKAKDAGTYYIWYKAVGDASHTDSSPTYVTATIGKAEATKTDPTAKTGLQYTGSPQALANGGSSSHGTFTYSSTQNGSYSGTIPTGTNAATNYVVYWKFTGDKNHADDSGSITGITIAKAPATLSVSPTGDISFGTADNVGATNTSKTASWNGGSVSVTSANTNVCTTSVNNSTGVITVTRRSVQAFSDVTVTVSVTPDGNHTAPTSVTFKVSAQDYTAGADANGSPTDWENNGGNIEGLTGNKDGL